MSSYGMKLRKNLRRLHTRDTKGSSQRQYKVNDAGYNDVG